MSATILLALAQGVVIAPAVGYTNVRLPVGGTQVDALD